MLVRGVIVDDHVDRLFLGHSGVDDVEKADKLLMAVSLHALADDLALKHVESCEQRRDAMTLVIVGHGAGTPFFIGNPGCVRSRAWIWLFSSTDSTIAWSGGLT